jgi:hypothetical protein
MQRGCQRQQAVNVLGLRGGRGKIVSVIYLGLGFHGLILWVRSGFVLEVSGVLDSGQA